MLSKYTHLEVSRVIVVFVRTRTFSQKLTQVSRQSQASLIWRELEEEDDGLDEGPRGLFHSALRRHRTQRNRDEEEEDGAGQSVRRRQRMSDYPDDDCVRYFVLGTLTAVLALFVNLVYPLLYKASWS